MYWLNRRMPPPLSNQNPPAKKPKKCDRWEEKEKRLEKMKTDLKLNANQRPLD